MTDSATQSSDFPAGKFINCFIPDDGTDKRLLAELRKKHGVVKAGSATRRGIGALGRVSVKRGKLPLPELVKQVYVICSEKQADEIFDFIFRFAQIDKPGRGVVWQQSVTGCTPFELPPDIPDEETGA